MQGFRATLWIVAVLVLSLPLGSSAQVNLRGLYLLTKYPNQDAYPEAVLEIPVTVANYGLPPLTAELAVEAPEGWRAEFRAEGRAVRAATVEPEQSVSVMLQVVPPADLAHGDYQLVLRAAGGGQVARTPLQLRWTGIPPVDIELSTNLPTLQGQADSEFKYLISMHNKSTQDLGIDLSARAPPGFRVRFTDQLKSQFVTSLPVNGGAKRAFNVVVETPARVSAGVYSIEVLARVEDAVSSVALTLEVVGREALELRAENARLSADAFAGEALQMRAILTNTGSAAARNVRFSGDYPQSWNFLVEPSVVDELAVGETVPVLVTVEPSPRALAGDYQLVLRAGNEGRSDALEYRLTVRTSTLWGSVGLLLVVLAVLLVGFAMMRFGRR